MIAGAPSSGELFSTLCQRRDIPAAQHNGNLQPFVGIRLTDGPCPRQWLALAALEWTSSGLLWSHGNLLDDFPFNRVKLMVHSGPRMKVIGNHFGGGTFPLAPAWTILQPSSRSIQPIRQPPARQAGKFTLTRIGTSGVHRAQCHGKADR